MENCLKITVEKSKSLEDMLKSFGYEKRCGSGAYERNSIVIIPKKKWYWVSNDLIGTQIITL